jgi:phosphatidylinositol 4-kinase
LNNSFAEANQEMAALLQQFLTTPSPIFEGPDAGIIQACAVERLAQTLKHFSAGEDVAMSTVYALLNTLYNHNTANGGEDAEVASQANLIQENVIAAISKIACVFKSEKVTSQACSCAPVN